MACACDRGSFDPSRPLVGHRDADHDAGHRTSEHPIYCRQWTTDLRIVTVDCRWTRRVRRSHARRLQPHCASTSPPLRIWSGAEQVGIADAARIMELGAMTRDVPVWVAVSAVDNVGNESAMTPAQSVTPKKLVDDDSIRDEVDRHRRQDQQCGSMTLTMRSTTSLSTITGTTTYWMPTEPDETTDPPPKAGDPMVRHFYSRKE